MKKLILFYLMVIGFLPAKAQQITNSGFENWWDEFGTYEDLMDWSTLNYLNAFGYDLGSKKITGKKDYAVELISVGSNLAGFPVPGIIATGELPQNSGPEIESMLIPFNYRPVYLNFWFQSLPKTGDSCGIIMVLTKYNVNTGEREFIAEAGFATGDSIGEWTEKNIRFNYFSQEVPDSAYLIASSSINSTNVFIGSIFRLDEINLVYTELSSNQIINENEILVYPNPTSSLINLDSEIKIDKIEIIGIDGKNYQLNCIENQIDISKLNSGIYFLKIISSEKIIIKKIIKI